MIQKSRVISLAVVIFTCTTLFSQSFSGKGSKQFQVGIGFNEHHAWYPENGKGPKGSVSPISGLIDFQFEFGITKYVGLGINIGGEYSRNLSGSSTGVGIIGYPGFSNSTFWSFAIPVGVHSNFHFFQLIADKSGKSLATDKLDIYAGISLGSGPAFAIPKSAYKTTESSDIGFMLYGGPHAGIRYYPSSKIGVYLEVGYGKAILNGGLAINL